MYHDMNKSLIEAATKILARDKSVELYESMLLVEDRMDFLKEKNPVIDTSHDALAQHHDSADIINHIAEHGDPTKKKIYTQWTLDQYKKKNIRQEDMPRVHAALSNFDKYKGKLEKKDINQYAHINDVEDTVEPHMGTAASKSAEVRQIKDEGADLIHSENGLTVHKLKTKEAACHYGKGTKWCTAAEKHNMFDTYHAQGPLYVVQKGDEKHQLHFETNQFMNAQDKPVNLHELVKKNPELQHVPEFKEKHIAFNSPEEQVAMVKSYQHPAIVARALEDGIKLPADAMHDVTKTAIAASESAPAGEKNPHDMVIGALTRHAGTPASALHEIYMHESSNPKSHRILAISRHPKLSNETAHALLNTHDKTVKSSLATNPSVTSDVLRAIHAKTSAEDHDVHEELALHPNTPHDLLTKFANGNNHVARMNALRNPSTPKEIIDQHAEDVRTHSVISKNPTASPETLTKIFKRNQDSDWIHENLAGNKASSVDLLQTLSEHPDAAIAKKAAKTLKGK